MRISNGKRFVNPLDKESWMWFNYEEVANKMKEERMDWKKILGKGSAGISTLLDKHADGIERTYNDAESSKGIDINLKLTIKPGKGEAKTVKFGISYAPERVKDGDEYTVNDNGEDIQIDAFDGVDPDAASAQAGSGD
jgi:hypothetical protein